MSLPENHPVHPPQSNAPPLSINLPRLRLSMCLRHDWTL